MTPKEKAKQLFDKFMPLVEAYSSDEQTANAKECALITVDEIIKEITPKVAMYTYQLQFWNEVKNEINNL